MKNFVKEVTVYDFEGIFDGFCVEVSEKKDERIKDEIIMDVYLYHKDYGVKYLMFGLLKKDIKDEWETRNIIANNIEEYIKIYEDKIMDK